MEPLNIPELYTETLSNLLEVFAGRQHLYEVYFYRKEQDGSDKKITCQSVYCPDDEESTYQILTERSELLAINHGIDSADIIMEEVSMERVDLMFNKLKRELNTTSQYHSLFFCEEML